MQHPTTVNKILEFVDSSRLFSILLRYFPYFFLNYKYTRSLRRENKNKLSIYLVIRYKLSFITITNYEEDIDYGHTFELSRHKHNDYTYDLHFFHFTKARIWITSPLKVLPGCIPPGKRGKRKRGYMGSRFPPK